MSTQTLDYSFQQPDQTVVFTGLDSRLFSSVAAEGDLLPGVLSRVAGKPGDGSLSRSHVLSLDFDLFNSLRRSVVEDSGVGSPLVRDLMDRARRSPGYDGLRDDARGDEVAAFLGAASLAESISASLSDELKNAAERDRQARRDAEDAEGYADLLSQDADADPDAVADAAAETAKKREAAKAAAAALSVALRDSGKAVQKAVASAVAKAADEVSGYASAARTFGVGDATASGGVSVAEKFKLAETVAKSGPKFRRLADMIGRMTREALAKQASKTVHDSGEIVDVTIGSEPTLLVDDELLALRSPRFRMAALARYVEDRMLQYDVAVKDTLGRGPIVVLFDESGSMQGQNEAVAKGIALALAHVASRQRRVFVCHFFQCSVTHTVRIDPADGPSLDAGLSVALRKMAEIASRGTGGGTDFDPVLRQSVETVKAVGKDRADVLLLTDGVAPVSDEVVSLINSLRASSGANYLSLLIDKAGAARDSVARFSSRVWSSSNLLDGTASAIFEAV